MEQGKVAGSLGRDDRKPIPFKQRDLIVTGRIRRGNDAGATVDPDPKRPGLPSPSGGQEQKTVDTPRRSYDQESERS